MRRGHAAREPDEVVDWTWCFAEAATGPEKQKGLGFFPGLVLLPRWEPNRSCSPVSRRSFGCIANPSARPVSRAENHSFRFEGLAKPNLSPRPIVLTNERGAVLQLQDRQGRIDDQCRAERVGNFAEAVSRSNIQSPFPSKQTESFHVR
jgi:hypothetical protein